MENKNIKTINGIGKAGRIISMILIVFMILAGIATLAGTIFAASLPKEDINVTVNGTADISSDGSLFTEFKKAVAVAQEDGDIDVDIIGGSDGIALAKIDGDDFPFDNANITETEKGYKVDFDASTFTFSLGKVIYGLIATLVYIICIVVTLFMLRKLFQELEKCETPFTDSVIARMKAFGFSLIPFVVLQGITDAAWGSMFKTGFDFSLNLDFTMIIVILVVFMLTMIFSYGAELQKQSDETL